MNKTKVIAISSDQHCGSTMGLCPRSVLLDDGGEYLSNKSQQWLDYCWGEFWQEVKRVRAKHKADLIEVFNGDFTDGNHHGTTQILSGNMNAQAACVDAALVMPKSLKPDMMLFIRGTEAHVGKSAAYEERIAKGLSFDKFPVKKDSVTGAFSHWHAKMKINGIRFDFAHHGQVGTRPWTTSNGTENLAAQIFYEHAKMDFKLNRLPSAPHFAIRSHMHQFVDTADKHPVRVLQTPCWQFKTAFIHRIDTSGKLPDIGGIIMVVHPNGETDVQPVLFQPDELQPIDF